MRRSTVEARRRRLARSARTCAVIGLAALLFGVLLHPPGSVLTSFIGRATASGGGGGGPGGQSFLNVTLNLTDAPSFDPTYLSVGAPSTVNLTLVNQGSLNHTFTLVDRPNFRLDPTWSPHQLDAYFHANGSQLNVSVAPGTPKNVSISFTAEQAGFSYEFVSQVPYQFQSGMFGFLNVTGASAGPGLVANVSAAAAALAWIPDAIGITTSAFPVTIDMAISNDGSAAHTFYLSDQPNYTVASGNNFTTYFAAHPPLASLDLPTAPGEVKWANFTVPKAGIYEYVCTIPGHFSGGMLGFLYIGVPVPVAPSAPSTEIVSIWVLYGGAGLLGLGAVLAGSALLVGRFPRSPSGGHGH